MSLIFQCAELKESLECLRFTKQSHLALSVGAQLNLPADQMSGLAEQLAENLRRDGGHREAARLYDRLETSSFSFKINRVQRDLLIFVKKLSTFGGKCT